MKALVFDLDGTLIDSTYQHMAAWTHAFRSAEIGVPVVEIHRRIGMNGSHMLDALDRAFELRLSEELKASLSRAHGEHYAAISHEVRLIDGAAKISSLLNGLGIGMAIATSAHRDAAAPFLDRLSLTPSTVVITSETEPRSKPAGDQFERAFAKLHVEPHDAAVVGDSTWDMLASRQAGSFGVGVLSGGYSQEELSTAGAFRVYRDVGEMLRRLEELGTFG